MPVILTRELPLSKARVYFTGTIQLVDAVSFQPELGQETPDASSVSVAESSIFIDEAFEFPDENEAIAVGVFLDLLGPDRSSDWELVPHEAGSFPNPSENTNGTDA